MKSIVELCRANTIHVDLRAKDGSDVSVRMRQPSQAEWEATGRSLPIIVQMRAGAWQEPEDPGAKQAAEGELHRYRSLMLCQAITEIMVNDPEPRWLPCRFVMDASEADDITTFHIELLNGGNGTVITRLFSALIDDYNNGGLASLVAAREFPGSA